MSGSASFRVICALVCLAAPAIDAIFGSTWSLRLLAVPPAIGLAYRGGALMALFATFLGSLLWAGLRVGYWSDPLSAPLLWETATRFGTLAIISLVVARLRRRVVNERSAADTDELTGLANRRGFDRWRRTVCGRLAASGTTVIVVYFDVDRFKAINDLHGHAAGDRVLKTVGTALQAATRQNDLLCRWGGDEFLVILPGATAEAAERILARLQQTLRAALRNVAGPDAIATLSGGASIGVPKADAFPLIDEADQRLAEAKAAGGDCIRGLVP